jgi:hypothetical protein
MNSYKQRSRDFAYLWWIKTQPCCVCEAQHHPHLTTTYAHHAGARGLGQKADDRTAIPLCWRHHDRGSSASIHTLGKWFWGRYGLDRNAVIAELQARYEGETGRIAA